MDFKQTVLQHLIELDMTQDELAARIGFDRAIISRVINGRLYRMDVIGKIADVFSVSHAELIGDRKEFSDFFNLDYIRPRHKIARRSDLGRTIDEHIRDGLLSISEQNLILSLVNEFATSRSEDS